MNFLEICQQNMEVLGFWTEGHKNAIIKMTERRYKPEVIKEWGISDLVIDGDKALIKWRKRMFPLTDEKLKEMYGNNYNHDRIK